jgi:broad specificity phosphatase PhoE
MKLEKNKGYVFFVRHGQTDWNLKRLLQGRDEIPLNETGLSQASWVAEKLRDVCARTSLKFDAVASSPLSRASVTAKKIANAIGCDDFLVDPRLIERDFGELSGKEYNMGEKYITGNDESVSGLEPVEDVYKRINAFITENAVAGKKIIAVSHGSATGVFTAVTKKAPYANKAKSVLQNCHMVIFSYDGNEILMEDYDVSPENLDLLEIE